MPASLFTNDGSRNPPQLRVYLNLDTLLDLRADSLFEAALLRDPVARDARLAADGFEGVQTTSSSTAVGTLPFCGADRINRPGEADALVAVHAARAERCLTVHVGSGLEDEHAALSLVEATLTASQKHRLPVFMETHRATITQDLWRTVQIARQFPEIRFNGDFSHYYCGQEMVYGDWDAKLAFMEPLFTRTGFLHGRVASPGCMQVPVAADAQGRPVPAHGLVDYVGHFEQLWSHAIRGFLRTAQLGDVLIFAPELLSSTYDYARLFPDAQGARVEESDRYAQALLYQRWIRAIFAAAQSDAPSTRTP